MRHFPGAKAGAYLKVFFLGGKGLEAVSIIDLLFSAQGWPPLKTTPSLVSWKLKTSSDDGQLEEMGWISRSEEPNPNFETGSSEAQVFRGWTEISWYQALTNMNILIEYNMTNIEKTSLYPLLIKYYDMISTILNAGVDDLLFVSETCPWILG